MDETWMKFLRGILKMPDAKVNREKFLRKAFSYLNEENMKACLADKPTNVVPMKRIEAKAKAAINNHLAKVTTLSAIAGIPGGFGMLVSVPADVANYYYHVVKVGQKLGYLYGYPDMLDEKGDLTAEGEVILTSFIGAMNNVEVAVAVIRKLAVEISKKATGETLMRIAGNLLQKQVVSHGVEAIARKLGAKVSAGTLTKSASKAIPFISGVICGGLSYATFRREARRLHKVLSESHCSGDQALLECDEREDSGQNV